jgi:DNA polymerase delta subunit 2
VTQNVDMETKDGEPQWVALISGLSAGSSEVPEDLKGQLLSEWLTGELGGVDVSLCNTLSATRSAG